MKRPIEQVGTIMERLGFNQEATEGAKAAFIQNLIKQAYGVEVNLPPKYKSATAPTFEEFTVAAIDKNLLDPKQRTLKADEENQLEFNLEPPKVG
jgi:hypothetical protein